jgi:hypothetical protein
MENVEPYRRRKGGGDENPNAELSFRVSPGLPCRNPYCSCVHGNDLPVRYWATRSNKRSLRKFREGHHGSDCRIRSASDTYHLLYLRRAILFCNWTEFSPFVAYVEVQTIGIKNSTSINIGGWQYPVTEEAKPIQRTEDEQILENGIPLAQSPAHLTKFPLVGPRCAGTNTSALQ